MNDFPKPRTSPILISFSKTIHHFRSPWNSANSLLQPSTIRMNSNIFWNESFINYLIHSEISEKICLSYFSSNLFFDFRGNESVCEKFYLNIKWLFQFIHPKSVPGMIMRVKFLLHNVLNQNFKNQSW